MNALGAGLVGTPQFIAERLRRYEEVGIDCMMTRFTPDAGGRRNVRHQGHSAAAFVEAATEARS